MKEFAEYELSKLNKSEYQNVSWHLILRFTFCLLSSCKYLNKHFFDFPFVQILDKSHDIDLSKWNTIYSKDNEVNFVYNFSIENGFDLDENEPNKEIPILVNILT